MLDLLADVLRDLAPADRTWLEAGRARCASAGGEAVALMLPALPRRVGRRSMGDSVRQIEGAHVDLGAWRACDVAASALLTHVDDDGMLDLFTHGDIEERTMLLRAATLRPLSAVTGRLFGEVQRTNTLPHFEALACDNDLAARACGAVAEFGVPELTRMVLKAAFLGLPLRRMFGVERHANPDLSRMLQDLATEREAAGRSIWPDTVAMMACAPVPGTAARILGDLEHGDDTRRANAVAALGVLGRAELAPFLRERSAREPRPTIRRAIEDLLARLG